VAQAPCWTAVVKVKRTLVGRADHEVPEDQSQVPLREEFLDLKTLYMLTSRSGLPSLFKSPWDEQRGMLLSYCVRVHGVS
jgi:hypothetical protein